MKVNFFQKVSVNNFSRSLFLSFFVFFVFRDLLQSFLETLNLHSLLYLFFS